MPSKQTKSVSAASRALSRLGVLIDDLLDLSRIDSDSLKIDYEIVSANSLVENLIEEFRLRFDSLGLTLNSESGSDGNIWCDPYRYSQIVVNLLSNAERYTPKGGTVTVSTEFEGAHFVLTVSDTGIGIPASKLDQIFDPFTTVSTVSYKKDGSTGLGLAIVQGLAELHGGNVEVVSSIGIGSSFRVSIPTTPLGSELIAAVDGSGSRNL